MKKFLSIIIAILSGSLAFCSFGQSFTGENFSRGFAGISTGNGFHLSWRALSSDKSGMSFEIFRQTDGQKAIKISKKGIVSTSDFFDTSADLSKDNVWFLKASGKELASFSRKAGEAVQYIEIPLDFPERRNIFRISQRSFGTSDNYNPGDAGDAYSYTAGDCSVGDLDGDGEMEIILKWDPTNASTPERTGITGNTLLDAYKLDGSHLWRIDLGHNIRSTYATVPFVVYDLDGDGKAEIVCKTADGTVDGSGKVLGNPRADWRSMDEASPTFGRTVIGPEFISVFNGLNGEVIASEKFIPIRFPLDSWGGIGGNDNEGIRCEKFTAGVAYLDGKTPSVFFVRGADAKTVVAAWRLEEGKLINSWTFDSSDPEWNGYSGNGNPNVSVSDFDGDGADEICVGAMIVDNDGKGLLTTKLRGGIALHVGDLIPSRKGIEVFGTHDNSGVIGAFLQNPAMAMYDGATGEIIWSKGEGQIIGRGMAADIDPRFTGAETWIGPVDPAAGPRGLMPFGGARGPMGPMGGLMREAAAIPEYNGPLKGLYNGTTGEIISTSAPSSCNFVVYWDADPLSELLDGTKISKWNWEGSQTETLFEAKGVKAINSTKSNPCFSGDILGDWREEIIWVSEDNKSLRIYMTDIPATNRIPCLLSDRQYRLSLVWQNAGYNQPAHTSFDLLSKTTK